MPRLPRFFVPDMPLHVIQRGNNRGPIFGDDADRIFYKTCLGHSMRRHGVAIHAYVLMTNHVHLLVTPARADSLPSMMQSVGRVYVQYFNHAWRRSGTLWEGRYKAAIVDDEGYLLICMRYIELNPVRSGMAARPDDYAWSSYRANARGDRDDLVTRHELYTQLATSPALRRAAYRTLFDSTIADDDLSVVRDATQHAWAIGAEAFRRKVAASGRRAERLPKGPRRSLLALAPRMSSPTLFDADIGKVESDPA